MKMGLYINQPGTITDNKCFLKYTNLVDFFSTFSHDDRFSGVDLCLPLMMGPLEGRQVLLNGYNKDKMSIVRLPYYMGADEMAKKAYKIIPMSLFQAVKLTKRCHVIGSVMPSIVGLVFCLVATAYKRKLFLIIRGDKVQSMQEFKGLKKQGYRLTMQIINRLIFTIFKDALLVVLGDDLANIYGKHCRNIHIIGAQIRDELFSLFAEERFPKNGKQIKALYLGRLSKEKNIEVLIEGVAQLSERYNMLLEIVGSGLEEKSLKRLVKKHHLEERVSFTGYVPYGEKLFSKYLAADLFVLPSLSEGIPRTILEAMCLRVPVISTKVGSIPTIVRDMDTGILFDPGDVKGLVEGMVLMFSQKTLRENMVRRAYNLAKEYSFSEQRERLIRRIIRFYREN